MRRNVTATMKNFGLQSAGTVFGIFFLFIAGVSAGVFTELMMGPNSKTELADYLVQSLFREGVASDLPAVFISSLKSNVGLLLVILLSGLTVIGFPVAAAAVVYKGMALGFTSALLLESLSIKGAAMILLTMVPPNLFLIPALLASAVCAVNLARTVMQNRKSGIKKSLALNVGPYSLIHGLLAVAVLIGCLVESFICPILLLLLK